MSLSVGDRLGPYEILGLIGAGGMGEVYRARDTKLKREVALKVLPEAFASDPERMARFQREAEVLDSFNHPNIAQIYGVEKHALVMELVEGVAPRGPMPFENASKIARQMADALEYAHEKGVIHRDLKPANIKITPQGVVKVLDFGLAAVGQVSPPTSDPAASPTLTIAPTIAGVILGTAAYMPPEQACGKPVDKRADIWSFGVVLFEILTGKRLFPGADVTEVLAAVIKDQPDFTAVPAQVRPLLRRCLEAVPVACIAFQPRADRPFSLQKQMLLIRKRGMDIRNSYPTESASSTWCRAGIPASRAFTPLLWTTRRHRFRS